MILSIHLLEIYKDFMYTKSVEGMRQRERVNFFCFFLEGGCLFAFFFLKWWKHKQKWIITWFEVLFRVHMNIFLEYTKIRNHVPYISCQFLQLYWTLILSNLGWGKTHFRSFPKGNTRVSYTYRALPKSVMEFWSVWHKPNF